MVALSATILILLIIFITNQFVHYLNDAANGKITVQAVMEVMSLQIPLLLGYLLPLSFFLGTLLTLGRFYVDHEMVVLSASGVSQAWFVSVVMCLAMVMMALVASLMLWVEPKMQWYQGKILTRAVTMASLEKVLPGRFQSLGEDNSVFYAARAGEHHQWMEDVLFATRTVTQKGRESWDLVVADFASEMTTPSGSRFIVFKRGARYVGIPGALNYQVTHFDEYGIRLKVPTSDVSRRIEAMPTSRLWSLHDTNVRAASELQWRLAMPLSVFVLGLLAVPLSYANPRKGKFARLLPAILIYIVYVDFLFVGRAWIEKGKMHPAWGLWWVHGAVFLLALLLLLYQQRERLYGIFFKRK